MNSGTMVIVDREKKAIVLRIDDDSATPNDLDTIKIARAALAVSKASRSPVEKEVIFLEEWLAKVDEPLTEEEKTVLKNEIEQESK